MATFTITTAVNIDTLASKAGSDTYNINGGYLTVDQHSRYGVNQNTSAAMGNITLSATLGGTIEFNSTLVRLIPYNTGTGNVPALDTTISQGSASGILLGIYSALNVAPTTAGSAMPASGFVLIRQWNSVAYAAGALTGIGASATGADVAGWLEIVGVDALAVTVCRLNLFKVRGAYFEFFGVTTSGSRATTYQLPTNGSAMFCPAVEVETAVASGVYESYPNAGSQTALVANIATDAVRGKWCWVSSAGLVTFGNDGTNSTGAYCPVSGLRIRVPNIFFQTCTAAAPTVNSNPHATLATRMEFTVTQGGAIDIDKCCMGWYMNFLQPYSVSLTNVAYFEAMAITECATEITCSNVTCGQTPVANPQIAFAAAICQAGGALTNCTWTRSSQASGNLHVASYADCDGFTVAGEKNLSLTRATSASASGLALNRVSNSTWADTLMGGVGGIIPVGLSGVTFTDTRYFDNIAATTGTTNAASLVVFSSSPSTNVMFDGLDFGGLALVQPYAGLLNINTQSCTDITLRNLGTAATPLDLGGAYVPDCVWARSSTTMTVTSTAHGLKAGDPLAVMISSDVTPKAVTTTTATLWTVAAITDADNFTVTVANSGATSGTLSYYPTVTALVLQLMNSPAASGVRLQRCYLNGLRTGIVSNDNAVKGLELDNVWVPDWNQQLFSHVNLTPRMLRESVPLTAQNACYGTHLVDFYTTGIPANTSAVAWTRASTTATVTSADHGLKTGDQIVVTLTSDAAAIILGVKTITATTSGAFTFTCLNAGGASGTLTFVALNGRVAWQMNEPTAETLAQITLANGAAFTSAGTVSMPTIGHQVDYTVPYSVRGHSSFPIAEAVMGGGTIGNYDITYSLDDGVTYSNLYYPRAGGGGSSASTNVTMTSTTGVAVGDYVWGTNIAPNAKVTSITNSTTVVVDIANTGTVSGVLRFNHLPSETVADPLVGFPLRLRIKTTTTNATAISSLYFFTNSTTAARAATYPMDTADVNLTGLVAGSEVNAYEGIDPATNTLLATTSSSGTSFSFQQSSAGLAGFIVVSKPGYQLLRIPITYGASNISIPLFQIADRAYSNP